MSKFTKIILPLGVYLLIGALVLHRAASLGFLADDVWGLYYGQQDWRTQLDHNVDPVHVLTLPFAIYYMLYQFLQLNPLGYHLFTFALIVVNALLVKTLAANLGLKPWQCWVAGLLVLLNSAAAEVYFWFVTWITVAMTGLLVIGLICLVRFRQTGSRSWGAGYLGMVLLAPFMEAKGVLLPGLGLILDRFWPGFRLEEKPKGLAGYKLHLLSFSILAAIMLFREFLGKKSSWAHLSLAAKYGNLKINLTYTLFHGLDDHLIGLFQAFPAIWKNIPFILWLLLLALLLAGLALNRGADRRRLLTFILLWGAACLPQSLAGLIQYRYFYLPGVFAALLIVSLLEGFSRRLASPLRAYLLISVVVLGYLFMDLKGFQLAINSFQEASRIYAAGMKQIKEGAPPPSPGARLILVDFPFYIYNQQAQVTPRRDRVPYVNIYSFSLVCHIKMLFQTEDLDVLFVRLSPINSPHNPHPLGDLVTPDRLKEMLANPRTRAVRYVPGSQPSFREFSG